MKKNNFKTILGIVQRKIWNIGHNPDTDWVIVFFFGCLLALVYVGWAGFIYEKVATGEFFNVVEAVPEKVEKLNIQALTSVTDYFEKIKSESLPVITVGDPSR